MPLISCIILPHGKVASVMLLTFLAEASRLLMLEICSLSMFRIEKTVVTSGKVFNLSKFELTTTLARFVLSADTGMGLMELLLLKWFSNIDLVVWRQFSQGPPPHLPHESPYWGANVATELFSATARL